MGQREGGWEKGEEERLDLREWEDKAGREV